MHFSSLSSNTLPLKNKNRIVVGMSGGVDSSVSALLLKEQGHEVIGLFMKNWEEDDTDSYCSAEKDIEDAQSVCHRLDIPLHTVNFAAEYWDNVFAHFLQEYKAGRTPNPDVLCNKEIKFKACLDFALHHLKADYFATGHYAQNINNRLYKSLDIQKDQTYFLYTMTPEILKKIIFPIGHLKKPYLRQIAEKNLLTVYNKKDSTGICFIGERRFKKFLSQYLPAQKGEIYTIDGKFIGHHDGLMYYTLGQRQGLNIGGQREGNGKAWYVVKKDLINNRLIIAQGHDHPSLFSFQLFFTEAHWIVPQIFPLICTAKIRHRQTDQLCNVTIENDLHYKVMFDSPQWAVTPGQSIVFYKDEYCLGGGIITAGTASHEN